MSERNGDRPDTDENVEPEAPDETAEDDAEADERSEESFPASDPPAW
jgi:hypothetical protein